MIVLSKADSQIVLYAKGHFGKRDDVVQDLRVLIAKRAGMRPEHISNPDMVRVLTDLLIRLNIPLDATFVEFIIFGKSWLVKADDAFTNFITTTIGLLCAIPVTKGQQRLVELQPYDPHAFVV